MTIEIQIPEQPPVLSTSMISMSESLFSSAHPMQIAGRHWGVVETAESADAGGERK